jgi:hypothetical protein
MSSGTAAPVRKKKATKETCTDGRWTQEEHDLFLKGMEVYGRRWTKVADIVGTRTTVQVRKEKEGGVMGNHHQMMLHSPRDHPALFLLS